ncbi:MAG: hypothetical protein V8R57_04175 [Evtepia sp.]
MERTQENLTRVADKLEELDLQRGPLKAQAEQAQTFLALRERLRTLEISLWMDQLDKQRAQRRKLQADRAAAQASLAACTQETDRLYAESERLLHDLRDQEAQGERLRQRLQAVRQQAEDSRQALTLRRERLRTGDETARRLRDELAQQETRTAHLQEEQTRQEDRLVQLQKQERKRAEAIARTEERLARTRTQARQAQAAWQETLRRERETLADPAPRGTGGGRGLDSLPPGSAYPGRPAEAVGRSGQPAGGLRQGRQNRHDRRPAGGTDRRVGAGGPAVSCGEPVHRGLGDRLGRGHAGPARRG